MQVEHGEMQAVQVLSIGFGKTYRDGQVVTQRELERKTKGVMLGSQVRQVVGVLVQV